MTIFKNDNSRRHSNLFFNLKVTISIFVLLFLFSYFFPALFSFDNFVIVVVVLGLLALSDILSHDRVVKIQVEDVEKKIIVDTKSILSGERRKVINFKDVILELHPTKTTRLIKLNAKLFFLKRNRVVCRLSYDQDGLAELGMREISKLLEGRGIPTAVRV